jgi:hypothetical protein
LFGREVHQQRTNAVQHKEGITSAGVTTKNQIGFRAFLARPRSGGRKGNGVMAKPEDYRRYAAECLRLAQRIENWPEKAMLLQMAETWRRLAEQAERPSASRQEE